MEELSDDDLIRVYREGDVAAFDALFARHHASVYNFARVMLDGSPDAEDVLQETFLQIARAARSYVPRGRFRVWMLRIARNLCLNRLDRRRRRRRLIAEGALGLVEPESADPDAGQVAEAGERAAELRRLIGELPERQREAVTLRSFEQMTYREIARVMDVPVGTVKTLIHRGRARLARGLEPFLEE